MGKTERSNGAVGKSDIEGKVARAAARKRGRDRVSNGREHMSQRGQRASFNPLSMTTQIAGIGSAKTQRGEENPSNRRNLPGARCWRCSLFVGCFFCVHG